MLEEIGSGAFGRAIKAKRRADQEIVVVKELIGRRMTQKEISEVDPFEAFFGYYQFWFISCVFFRQRMKSKFWHT